MFTVLWPAYNCKTGYRLHLYSQPPPPLLPGGRGEVGGELGGMQVSIYLPIHLSYYPPTIGSTLYSTNMPSSDEVYQDLPVSDNFAIVNGGQRGLYKA